ncbi:hypothetical protein V6R21_20355 [Limibacter armeniacum]|uniref:hypothetical protein n=1 Tax=Limibacter armeniacum TaxID=466084 RepID=UPI002FE52B5D
MDRQENREMLRDFTTYELILLDQIMSEAITTGLLSTQNAQGKQEPDVGELFLKVRNARSRREDELSEEGA